MFKKNDEAIDLEAKRLLDDGIFTDFEKAYLEAEKTKNPDFAKSARMQLEFVYKNSDYYEKTYMRYPIGRLQQNIKLNLK